MVRLYFGDLPPQRRTSLGAHSLWSPHTLGGWAWSHDQLWPLGHWQMDAAEGCKQLHARLWLLECSFLELVSMAPGSQEAPWKGPWGGPCQQLQRSSQPVSGWHRPLRRHLSSAELSVRLRMSHRLWVPAECTRSQELPHPPQDWERQLSAAVKATKFWGSFFNNSTK